MNSRERINKALSHEETDRVPIDFAGSTWTGITRTAYQHLLKYLGRAIDNPCWVDVIQQLVLPSEEVLDLLHSDTRGLFPLTSHNWDVYSKTKDYVDYLEYKDEWGLTHRFPKNGFWFSLVDSPLKGADLSNLQVMDSHHWPDARNATRFQGLRELALQIRQHDKIVMTKGFCAGLFEMHQRLRGMENAMLDPMLFPITSDMLIGKLADLKIEFWDAQLNEIGDLIDIAGEGDDYGTQQSQLIAPEQFRSYYKPHMERVLKFIKQKNPEVKILFHSCGNVRPILPDLIEMGVDILNPVHITATGMEPKQLKKDFGDSLVFWGGGIDTQFTLPSGSVQEVKDEVKKNIDALGPGGGFVFSTVHNIQAEVPPQNILAMIEAIQESKKHSSL